MQKITPCLWFDDRAEEAANFYVSVFSSRRGFGSGGRPSRIVSVTRYGEAGSKASGVAKGKVMTVAFELEGQDFLALNGGAVFKLTEAISFIVNCDTQEELDDFWEKLSEGGDEEAQQCGWLKDKFGLSWQIVPAALGDMMSDTDPKKAERVMAALLQMKKIDIETLKRAYEQEARSAGI